MQAYLRHGKEGVGGVSLLHEALQVMLHELHDHEHVIQLLAHHHLPHHTLIMQWCWESQGWGGEEHLHTEAMHVARAVHVTQASEGSVHRGTC